MNATRSLLGLLACAVGLASSAFAQTLDRVQPTISEREANDLVRGLEIDSAAPDYCEKAREICLVAECGALSRDRVNKECWLACTARRYDACLIGKSERDSR